MSNIHEIVSPVMPIYNNPVRTVEAHTKRCSGPSSEVAFNITYMLSDSGSSDFGSAVA